MVFLDLSALIGNGHKALSKLTKASGALHAAHAIGEMIKTKHVSRAKTGWSKLKNPDERRSRFRWEPYFQPILGWKSGRDRQTHGQKVRFTDLAAWQNWLTLPAAESFLLFHFRMVPRTKIVVFFLQCSFSWRRLVTPENSDTP